MSDCSHAEEVLPVLQLSFALLVGIGTSYFDTRLLVEALALTCITVAAIFIVVTSTSVDFTQAGLSARQCPLSVTGLDHPQCTKGTHGMWGQTSMTMVRLPLRPWQGSCDWSSVEPVVLPAAEMCFVAHTTIS